MLVQVAGSAAPQVKLLDFGVAKIREDKMIGGVVIGSANKDVLATSVGALMGTAKSFTTDCLHAPTL